MGTGRADAFAAELIDFGSVAVRSFGESAAVETPMSQQTSTRIPAADLDPKQRLRELTMHPPND
jgi:hypothetical protein